MSILELRNVEKIYGEKDNQVKALRNINLKVEEGEFVAIVGTSGSGKSTCLNLIGGLDNPTSGQIFIKNKEIGSLSRKELTIFRRRNIGFVFQNYSLMPVLNVYDNVALPVTFDCGKHINRKYIEELLRELGIWEKRKKYPNELSGGQQQRVAIARAIANNPKILLCDEATSALDPQTTKSVLELLKQINRDYGITIVVVTHEMSVVQEICNQVAILNEGNVVETGSVSEIFTAPKSPEAKSLIIGSGSTAKEMRGRHCIRIVFKENSSYEPVVGNMTLQFKTPVNILYANTKDLNGTAAGEMILQLPEDTEIAGKMVEYLKEKNLYVGEVEQDVFI